MLLLNDATVKVIFLGILGILAWKDYKQMIVPNFIIFIGIAFGLLLTNNILWSILAGIIGLIGGQFKNVCNHCGHEETYSMFKGLWGGGDVKLFTMIGAFVGQMFLPIAIFGYLFAQTYRLIRKFKGELPLTPFILFSSLIFIWI